MTKIAIAHQLTVLYPNLLHVWPSTALKVFAIKVKKNNYNLKMTIDAETNTGESVLKHKCLGFGFSMEFIKTQGRVNHHNFCPLYKNIIEEKNPNKKQHKDI